MSTGQAQRIDSGVHPLIAMSRALDEFDGRLTFHTGAPVTDGWVPLGELGDRELISALLDESPANGMRLRNAAAAQFGASLACAVVRPLMAMLHLYESAPVVTPTTAFARRRAGRFRDLCLIPAEMLTTRDGDHPALRPVADAEDLLRHTADTIVTLLAPSLRALRVEGRFGLNQLWGSVLDMIGATSLLVGRLADLDQTKVWQHAERLCALVQERVDNPRVKYPTPFSVPWHGRDAMFIVKGTCCLQYREYGLRAGEPDDEGKAYCKTCPVLGEQDRIDGCASQLERDLRVRRYVPE